MGKKELDEVEELEQKRWVLAKAVEILRADPAVSPPLTTNQKIAKAELDRPIPKMFDLKQMMTDRLVEALTQALPVGPQWVYGAEHCPTPNGFNTVVTLGLPSDTSKHTFYKTEMFPTPVPATEDLVKWIGSVVKECEDFWKQKHARWN